MLVKKGDIVEMIRDNGSDKKQEYVKCYGIAKNDFNSYKDQWYPVDIIKVDKINTEKDFEKIKNKYTSTVVLKMMAKSHGWKNAKDYRVVRILPGSEYERHGINILEVYLNKDGD